MRLLPQPNFLPVFLLLFFSETSIRPEAPTTILWAAPSILLAAILIAWAAESAQFFIPQGVALAILAWMQTLPEFAVEGVIAWKQETPLLLANLTGALRLLTGLGWPVIYFTAAMSHRKREGTRLEMIKLDENHCAQIIGLLVPLIYTAVIVIKGSLNIFDAIILIAIYGAYLWVLSKLPSEEHESIDELESIPRAIVTASPWKRTFAIFTFFAAGGTLIYLAAEPFLGSLLAIATSIGIPSFVFIQWMAPLVSEFPEMASTVYFARQENRAPMALMNMVSSNINQWTLLAAMLPILLSISIGHPTPIVFDWQQKLELTMTLGQALVGMIFLFNMELAWWEAATLFALFLIPFAHPAAAPIVTILYFTWAGVELYRMIIGKRRPEALMLFIRIWKTRVKSAA